ncbi:MAG: tRNA (guanosine(46)-N7)-methyltransferase TrmB [Microbacteriaceae bacterium]|jgi:tRNA (guanine-N7-)-methyltransferase|nr:tRNA (guanosine(46)-N7)-methyltransferase TrmB [Microbacteriaceae bacterium]
MRVPESTPQLSDQHAEPEAGDLRETSPAEGKSPDPRTFRKQPVSFVRRGGRITDSQERAWEELGPRFLVDLPRGYAATSIADDATLDPIEVYGRSAPLTVEIGSGQGHAIVHAATEHPERDFLAVEVFKGGLARTMIRADWAEVSNLRMIEANAPEVLEHALPKGSVDELWVFFPDPWAKTKHHKRRLISPAFTLIAARALRDGGTLRLATDWQEYADHMREVLDAAPNFVRAFEGEWAPRFDGRVLTAFEQKGIKKGRDIRDLTYRRTASE